MSDDQFIFDHVSAVEQAHRSNPGKLCFEQVSGWERVYWWKGGDIAFIPGDVWPFFYGEMEAGMLPWDLCVMASVMGSDGGMDYYVCRGEPR